MAKIYANLIIKGLKKIEDVPLKIREEVRKILEDKNQRNKITILR